MHCARIVLDVVQRSQYVGSTNFNLSIAELFILYKSVMDTLEIPLLAFLLQQVGDVVFLVSWLLPVTVPVRSPFLYVELGMERRSIVYFTNF